MVQQAKAKLDDKFGRVIRAITQQKEMLQGQVDEVVRRIHGSSVLTIVLSLPHAPSEGSGGVRLTARAGMRGARENRGAPRGIESSRNWTSRNWSEWLMIRSEKIR